jgi:ORF6N domain
MKEQLDIIPTERIKNAIFVLRGQKVMLDSELAELYGVPTKVLNRAVRRNLDRFPGDFMFQLTHQELTNLRFQIGTSSSGYGGRRHLPYVFTEQGVAMLSSVLRSERAVRVNIAIMRAFIKLREAMNASRELAKKFAELETRVGNHDEQIAEIIEAIRQLIAPPETPKKEIGFHVKETSPRYRVRKSRAAPIKK